MYLQIYMHAHRYRSIFTNIDRYSQKWCRRTGRINGALCLRFSFGTGRINGPLRLRFFLGTGRMNGPLRPRRRVVSSLSIGAFDIPGVDTAAPGCSIVSVLFLALCSCCECSLRRAATLPGPTSFIHNVPPPACRRRRRQQPGNALAGHRWSIL